MKQPHNDNIGNQYTETSNWVSAPLSCCRSQPCYCTVEAFVMSHHRGRRCKAWNVEEDRQAPPHHWHVEEHQPCLHNQLCISTKRLRAPDCRKYQKLQGYTSVYISVTNSKIDFSPTIIQTCSNNKIARRTIGQTHMNETSDQSG